MSRTSPAFVRLFLLLGFLSLPLAAMGQNESTPVYIEDSPDADEQVKQAQHLLDQKRYTEAADLFQKISKEYARKLMKWDGAVHVDVPRWVRMTIRGDAQLLDAYRKLFEPVASRGLDEASKPVPDLAKLTPIVEQYSLCPSGLEAALRSASLLLESARWAEAARTLEELSDHPDIARHQARWRLLTAAAALYGGDTLGLAAQREALKKDGHTAALKQLDEWAGAYQARTIDAPRSAMKVLPKVDVPQPLGKPLYIREGLAEPDEARNILTAEGIRRVQPEPEHYILPAAQGDTVYVNTGLTLRALDRSSLSDVWGQAYAPMMPDGSTIDRFARGQPSRDPRGVLVMGDKVVAIMGKGSMSQRGPWVTTLPDTVLACVNRADGKALWKKSASDLDHTLGTAFFHGTPVGEGGVVYGLIRRSQNAGFRDSFVAAVDLKTGALLWRRHISSCSVRYTLRPYSQLLLAQGRLFVADHLGAVACLDSRTGAIQWLHKMSELRSSTAIGGNVTEAPWQISPPVLVKAGLITPPFLSNTTATLLDPRTGKKLDDLDVAGFLGASYMMEVNGDVLCVGSSVQLRDGQSLNLKWKQDLSETAGLVGRAAVTADRVLIPIDGKLVTLNLADGTKLSDSPLDMPGNVLALDGQVLITSGASVRSYMTWPVVYANLTSRIRREPTDPQPGLSLANAAIASGRKAEALEGVDHVVAVLRHRSLSRPADLRPEADDVHAELFQQLLRLVDSAVTPDPQLRGEFFDRVAKATITARDQVQYHLAYGAHLMEVDWPKDQRLDRWREAVRQLQTILESPSLSAQLVPRSGSWQQAGLEARMRLVAMIEKFGRQVYEEYDDRAAEQFDRLTKAGEPDAAAIIELARKYPLARSTPAMLLAAGEQLAQRSRHVEAITQLRRAFREKPTPQVAAKIVGQVVQSYVQIGKPRRARQWLQRAERDNLALVRGGEAITARQWLSELGEEAVAGVGVLPQVRPDLGKPLLIEGRLMTPAFQPRDQWPTDRIITSREDAVQLRGGPALDKIWEVKVEQNLELLWLNETAVLFWHEPTRTLIALDMRSGKRLWSDVKADAIFRDMMGDPKQRDPRDPLAPRAQVIDDPFNPRPAGERMMLREGRMINLGDGPAAVAVDAWMARSRGLYTLTVQGRPVLSDSLFAERPVRLVVNDAIVAMADSGGRVVGIDMDNGQILWRYICPFDRLGQIAIGGEAVALAGVIRPQAEDPTYLVTTLDALTGDMLCQVESPGAIAWLGLSDAGSLLYVSESDDARQLPRVSMHQLPDGGLQWRGDLPVNRLSAVGQAGDAVIVLSDRGDVLIADTINRKVKPVAAGFALERGEPVDIFAAGEVWHLMSPRQSVTLTADFALRWRDGLDEEVGERITQLIGRDHAVVVTLPLSGNLNERLRQRLEFQGLPNPRLEDDLPVVFNLTFVDRKTGLIDKEFHLPLRAGRIDPVRSLLLSGRLVFGVGGQTIVIPDQTK